MAKIPTSISIDADIKSSAQALLADLGMDMSTAINIFLRQMVWENRIPFSISRDVPNADTVAALREADEFSAHPERFKRYRSFAEVLQEVANDA